MRIRAYEDRDLHACRALWRELTQWHRELYEDTTIGGDQPELGFDSYVEEFGRERVWVAEQERVVALAGLIVRGRNGELEPVVVDARARGRGIGRALVEHVVEAARAEGLRRLTVRPVARNADALQFFHAAGFDVLGHVDLQIDLTGTGFHPRAGERLAGREFRV